MNEPRLAPEHVHNAPNTSVGDNSPQAHASVNDRTGLHIAIIALALAGLALGVSITQPQITEANIRAAKAEAVKEMQESLATAKADMDAANTNARLAIDRADKMGAALEAKGLIKLENH